MRPNEIGLVENYLNVKDLLLSVCKRMVIIILAGCLVGGALGSYKFIKRAKTNDVLDAGTRLNSRETDIQYKERVQNIDRARDIADMIDNVNYQINKQREYIDESVYMDIDPENEYEAMAQIVLTLENNDTNGLDQILFSAYERDVKAGTFLNAYAEEYGTKPDYIKELISFWSSASDGTIINIDSSADRAGSIYIRIYGPTKEFVDDVLAMIIDEVQDVYNDLNTNIAPHTLNVVGTQSICRIDSGTRDGQINQIAKLDSLQKQVVSYGNSLDKVAEELGLSDKEEILEYFATNKKVEVDGVPEETSEVTLGLRAMLKPAIKFGVIGFAAGAFLAAAFFVLKYIFAVKIATQEQFFNQFSNIRKIGVLKPSGKRGKYATFIDIKSGDDSKMTPENNKKLISANYDNITKEFGKILITGTGDSKALGDAVKALGLRGDFRPDIFSDPDILKVIPDYDAVVIMEQRKVSTFKTVTSEIELISNAGTDIVGAIII